MYTLRSGESDSQIIKIQFYEFGPRLLDLKTLVNTKNFKTYTSDPNNYLRRPKQAKQMRFEPKSPVSCS